MINSTSQLLKQLPTCSDRNLTRMQDESIAASGYITEMNNEIGCDVINPFITEIFHKVICDDVVNGVYKIWVVQLTCAVSLWVLLFLVMAEILTRETESRLNLAMQEQRLDLKPSMFIPRKGTKKRRLYDRKTRKDRLADDRAMAEELSQLEQNRADDELAWAAADAEAVAEVMAYSLILSLYLCILSLSILSQHSLILYGLYTVRLLCLSPTHIPALL